MQRIMLTAALIAAAAVALVVPAASAQAASGCPTGYTAQSMPFTTQHNASSYGRNVLCRRGHTVILKQLGTSTSAGRGFVRDIGLTASVKGHQVAATGFPAHATEDTGFIKVTAPREAGACINAWSKFAGHPTSTSSLSAGSTYQICWN